MAWVTLVITVPLAVFSVLFAVVNHGTVDVHFPFPEMTLSLPVYLFGLGMLGTGFFAGALFVWLLDQKTRFKCWKETRRADRLEKELGTLKKSTHIPANDALSLEQH
ncbi:MAG: LapA family protein [Alphaproteobacteria bacterium]|nr:LapA family protein [Alphaproteobacteria bacterium]